MTPYWAPGECRSCCCSRSRHFRRMLEWARTVCDSIGPSTGPWLVRSSMLSYSKPRQQALWSATSKLIADIRGAAAATGRHAAAAARANGLAHTCTLQPARVPPGTFEKKGAGDSESGGGVSLATATRAPHPTAARTSTTSPDLKRRLERCRHPAAPDHDSGGIDCPGAMADRDKGPEDLFAAAVRLVGVSGS